jgi:iron complex outermembrane recepter protein
MIQQQMGWGLLIGVVGAMSTLGQPLAAQASTETVDEWMSGQVDESEQPTLPSTHLPIHPSTPHPANTVDEWLTQIAQATVQITGVRLESTDSGLQVVLETAGGELVAPTTRSLGNALIAEFPNAVLALPEGGEFFEANPAEGIALMSATNLAGDTVQVAITGVDAAPSVAVSSAAGGFTLSVVPGIASAEAGDEAIQVVVTGAQDEGYNPSNATTATRTDTPLRDVPASVSVIPRQVLEDQGAVRLDEALRNVSGVTFSNSVGNRGQNFLIRGFGATQFRNGLREDAGGGGTFNTRTAQETANIERIEVLRGPASVLFGQGEPGGIINLVSKAPLDTPFYEVSFTGGSFDFYRPTLDFSGPITADGAVAYRLNVAYENAGSFRDFVDSRRYFIAPTIAWTISPSTSLNLEVSYLQDRRAPDTGLIVLNGDDRPANLPFSRTLADPNNFTQLYDETRATLVFDHAFADNLSIRSAFRYTTSFESFRDGLSFINNLRDDNRTVELGVAFGDQFFETYTFQNDLIWEFNTGTVDHRLLLGLELSSNIVRFSSQAPDNQQNITGGLLDIFNPDYSAITYTGGFQVFGEGDFSDRRTFGVYLQDQISLSDNFKLLVGGRLDTSSANQLFQVDDFATSQQDTAFSPRAGLVYQPNEMLSLYASYSRSFVPQGGRSATNTPFEPTRGTLYEVGAKANFLEGRLSTTLAAYNITRSNLTTPDPNNPNFSIQVGEQRSRGIDLDVVGEILPGWDVIASYGLIDATITRDNRFDVGNRLINIPQHSASLWTTYRLQTGNLAGLGFGAGAFFVGERTGDLANTFTLPGYTRFDAAVYYERDRFRAGLNFKNLFNAQYFAGSQGRLSVLPGAPFEVQGTLSWQF